MQDIHPGKPPLHPKAERHLGGIAAETLKLDAASRLSGLVLNEGKLSPLSNLSPEQHAETSVGTSELTHDITADIAVSLGAAYEMLAGKEAPSELTPDTLWQTALGFQREAIIDARDKHDEIALKKKMGTYIASIEMMVQPQPYSENDEVAANKEVFGHYDSWSTGDDVKRIRRSQQLEPLLEAGLAAGLIDAARQIYGLVVVEPRVESDLFDGDKVVWGHSSVAHAVESCRDDIELGLKKHMSLDPAEPALSDMPQEIWRDKIKSLGVRESAYAAVVMAGNNGGQEKPSPDQVALCRRVFGAFDTPPNARNKQINNEINSVSKLLSIPGVLDGHAFDTVFQAFRLSREVNNHYRINDQNNYRKDRLAVELIRKGETGMASKLITANQDELNGSTYATALDTKSGDNPEDVAVLKTITSIVEAKQQILSQRVVDFVHRFEVPNKSYNEEFERNLRRLMDHAHDPESALPMLDGLIGSPDKDVGIAREHAQDVLLALSKDLGWNDEVVFNALEAANSLGMTQSQIKELQIFSSLVPNPKLHGERIDALVSALEHTVVQELMRSDGLKSQVAEAINSLDTDLLGGLAQTFENQITAALISYEEGNPYIKLDVIAHMHQWQDLKVPQGMTTAQAVDVVRKRLGRRDAETGQYPEQPAVSVSILKAFELPDELSDENLLAKQKEFIISVLLTGTLDKLPSPRKEDRLKAVLPDDSLRELYKQIYATKQSDLGLKPEDIVGLLQEGADHLDWLNAFSELPPGTSPSTVNGQLRVLNARRRQMVLDRERWFKEYAAQSISTVNLKNAWQVREMALKEGAEDNPSSLLAWAQDHAFDNYLEQIIQNGRVDNIPDPEQVGSHRPLIRELSRVYPPHVVLSSLQRYLNAEASGKLGQSEIQPGRVVVRVDDSQFEVEILAKEDPRGMTIGADTGCCMTLDGASRDCIWAGYEDPRYGFFAVYKNGRLRAQSLAYINQDTDRRNVLVFDNIEANTGTDLSVIRKVYEQATQQFISQNKFKREVARVNIGVGFTQEELLAGLEDAKAVPSPIAGLYSDAGRQKLLLKAE